MSQQLNNINRSTTSFNSISFQQKSTGLSLLITSSLAAYYVARMWPMRPIALANDIIPEGYGGLLLSTVGLVIVAQIVLQSVLVFGAGGAPAATPLEKMAASRAARIGYGVLAAAVFAAVGTVFLDELTPFCTANIAIMGFFLAEISKGSAQLIYARQTASG
ncbi:MAG: hypothetical protein KDE04_22850 [Anaerolineales bacterium]|nr:hypothetical protein [Anaerolineales bacterium]MCB0015814.1 hypothetical protein [Anaerolineales bacterium]